MNRDSLRAMLDEQDADPTSYSLEGKVLDEAYVLEESRARFSVFYSERGLRSGEKSFATEDEACRHLMHLLLRDRTTRRSPDGS